MQQSLIDKLIDETRLMLQKLKNKLIQQINRIEILLNNKLLDEQELLLIQKSISRMNKYFITNFNIIFPEIKWTVEDDKYIENFLSNKPQFEIFEIAYNQLRDRRKINLSSERTQTFQRLEIDSKTKVIEQLSNTYYYGCKNKEKYCGRGFYVSDTTLLDGYFQNGDLKQGIEIELINDQIKVLTVTEKRTILTFSKYLQQYDQNLIDNYINYEMKNKILLAKYNEIKSKLELIPKDLLKGIGCNIYVINYGLQYYGEYNVGKNLYEGKGILFNNYLIKAGLWMEGILQRGFRLICLSNQCFCDEPHISIDRRLDDLEAYAYALELKNKIMAGEVNFEDIFGEPLKIWDILYYSFYANYEVIKQYRENIDQFYSLQGQYQHQLDNQYEFTVLMDYENQKYIYLGQVNKFNHQKDGRGLLLINKEILLNGYFTKDIFYWGMYINRNACEIKKYNFSINRLIEKYFQFQSQRYQQNQQDDEDEQYFQQH